MENRNTNGKRDENSNNTLEVPTEICMEILYRTPLQFVQHNSLLVCKLWETVGNCAEFQIQYGVRNKIVKGYMVEWTSDGVTYTRFFSDVDKMSSIPLLEFESQNFFPTIVASCNGLLLQCNASSTTCIFSVNKPTTGQSRLLPNPEKLFETKAVGMSVTSLDPMEFMILRLSQLEDDDENIRPSKIVESHEIYCFLYIVEKFESSTCRWTRIRDLELPYHHKDIQEAQGIYARGRLHWNVLDSGILSFNIDREMWTMLKLPREENDDIYKSQSYTAFGFEGKVAVMYFFWGNRIQSADLELFVLDRYNNRGWTSCFKFCLDGLYKGELYPLQYVFIGLSCRYVGVFRFSNKLVWYNLKSGEVETVKMFCDQFGHFFQTQAIAFASDYQPCQWLN